MANNKVVIDIIAPNTRTFNMLEFVLQQHGKGRFELSRGNRPDLVVVDFDKSDVLSAFRKFRSRFPETPAVLLLNLSEEYETLPDEVRIGAEYLLLKPFAAKDFISKINECLGGGTPAQPAKVDLAGLASPHGKENSLTGMKSIPSGNESSNRKVLPEPSRKSSAPASENTIPLQTSTTGNQPVRLGSRQRTWPPLESEKIAYSFALESEIDMADDAAVKNIWLKTDNKLLGYLKSAISQQVSAPSAICFSIQDNLNIHISPYAKTVALVGENINLQELAGQDFINGQITVRECAMPDNNLQLRLEMESFLWKLALHTYRGYLPEGINVNKPVYLKYWPNLTRLEPTPNAMRIASLLCRQPVALAFIVRILNIPQRHVFNFYAAANAAGYAGPAVREVDNMLLPSYPDELGDSAVQGYIDNPVSRNMNAL
jgi:DNA-binding NarL/FixJ family response regulator